MKRIKDTNAIKFLENVLNYTDEELLLLKENSFLDILTTREGIGTQITESIKLGNNTPVLLCGKVVLGKCVLEKISVELEYIE